MPIFVPAEKRSCEFPRWDVYGTYVRGRGQTRLRFAVVAATYELALVAAIEYARQKFTDYAAIVEDTIDVQRAKDSV